MPDTGLLPTIAMALAANRSEEKSDNGYEKHSGEREEQVAFHDPEIEKQQDGCQGQREPTAMIFIDKSFCVRGTAVSLFPLPFISCAARPTAPMMILRLLKMPMIPGHGDTADTDAFGILEDLFGTGLGGCNGRTSGTHDEVGEQP